MAPGTVSALFLLPTANPFRETLGGQEGGQLRPLGLSPKEHVWIGTGLILGQAVSFPGVTENFSVWRDYPLVVTSQLNGEVLKHVKLERDHWENGWKRKGRGWGGGDEDEHGEAKVVTPREVGVTAQQRRGQAGRSRGTARATQ